MRLLIVAVGRMKAGPERDLAERYRALAEKTGRASGLKGVAVLELDESRARRANERLAAEAEALSVAIPKESARIVLDAGGQALTSEALAGWIGRSRDSGRPAVSFIIGGADGVDPEIRKRADLVLSFGAVTWPHQLIRIMLLEQVYRTMTILCGHPYHRG